MSLVFLILFVSVKVSCGVVGVNLFVCMCVCANICMCEFSHSQVLCLLCCRMAMYLLDVLFL